jgi:hypothetical protein
MVLHGRLCGRVERRQIILQKALTVITNGQGFLRFSSIVFYNQTKLNYKVDKS